MSKKIRLGVLISGRGSNLQSIIDTSKKGEIDAEIAIVISDKKDAYGLVRAKENDIPALFLSPKDYKKREDFDEKVVEELNKHKVDLVLLAGFMRIVTSALIEPFRNRIMNIHPSLLPSFPGLDAQKQALEHGVRFSGCTVHFVEEGMDEGPIIIQAVVPVMDNDTVDSLSERILKYEHKIYPIAVQLFADGRLKVEGRMVRVNKEGMSSVIYKLDDNNVKINPILERR
ncbi:MAG: phosphoribosylglycinamide formyltransferase [Nitrospirae bacterium RBG_19FT_COMBO_42_15]|nr:MAG: phosphoribosylglycinamide formyltransferase [Nitrospirae bacterium RBG_19FT_COMBO_42_15]